MVEGERFHKCAISAPLYFDGLNFSIEQRNALVILKKKGNTRLITNLRSDEGLTLEASALKPFTEANLHFQLSR